MNMNALEYDQMNILQMRDAQTLIERIKRELGQTKIDCIVDIGCGTGNITVLLNDLIGDGVQKIYGFDSDDQMIEFAKRNNSRDNIEYFVQDITLDWDQLRSEFKELEGKVSLIFNNYCLHWVYTKRENVAKNMSKIMKENAKIYSQFQSIDIPSKRLKSRLGAHFFYYWNLFFPVPTLEEQQIGWSSAFKIAGFEIIECDLKESSVFYEKEEFDTHMTPMGTAIYCQFYGWFGVLLGNTLRVITGFKASGNCPQFIDENTGKTMVDYKYNQFTYIVAKR